MFYYLSALKLSLSFFKKKLKGVKVPPPSEPCRPRAHTSRTRELPAEEESRGEQNSIGIESEINFGKLKIFTHLILNLFSLF